MSGERRGRVRSAGEPWEPWQSTNCPTCGVRATPYGGFGSDPEWRSVGKYICRAPGCNGNVWYADPVTGIHYDRGRRGIEPRSSRTPKRPRSAGVSCD